MTVSHNCCGTVIVFCVLQAAMNTLITPTQSPSTLIEQVMNMVYQRIAHRSLKAGDKLPSIRLLATQTGFSKSTVTEAYNRLVDKGIVQPLPRSGYIVAPTVIPLSLENTRLSEKNVDPLWVSRHSLERTDTLLKPGCGWLPEAWMPESLIRGALRACAKAPSTTLLNYDAPRGALALRQILSRRLAEQKIHASPDQLILTDSTTQAVDLICRSLLEPDDVVLVDDPCYFNFLALMRAHRVKVISVPYTATGPDLALFAKQVATHRPKLYLTNVSVHNPTGASLSSAAAFRILQLAEQFNFAIIEDETFSDFELQPSTHLAALDSLHRVFVVGGFTKTLSASVRCGFIAAPEQWLDDLINLRVATGFSGNRLTAEIIRHALESGSYKKHIQRLRQQLSSAMTLAIQHLKRIGFTPWIEPTAGFFIWCQLPNQISSSQFAQYALQQYNMVLAPGNVFSPSHQADQFMRFNASQMTDPAIFDLLQTLLTTFVPTQASA